MSYYQSPSHVKVEPHYITRDQPIDLQHDARFTKQEDQPIDLQEAHDPGQLPINMYANVVQSVAAHGGYPQGWQQAQTQIAHPGGFQGTQAPAQPAAGAPLQWVPHTMSEKRLHMSLYPNRCVCRLAWEDREALINHIHDSTDPAEWNGINHGENPKFACPQEGCKAVFDDMKGLWAHYGQVFRW